MKGLQEKRVNKRHNSDHDAFIVLILSVIICALHLYKQKMEENEAQTQNKIEIFQPSSTGFTSSD